MSVSGRGLGGARNGLPEPRQYAYGASRPARVMPGTTAPRNGMPPSGGYVYRGTGRDAVTPPGKGGPRPGGGPALTLLCLDALAALGGQGTSAQVRRRLAADGHVTDHVQVAGAMLRLSRRAVPLVTAVGAGGRERTWRLASPAAPGPAPLPVPAPPAAGPARCRACGYLTSAPGHEAACGGTR